jgi:CRISPR-associated protein Csh1
MEEKKNHSTSTLDEKNSAIFTFFDRMGYTDDQRAMFYLGRILNSVGRAQYDKGHKSKPVLQKINYNGMDAAALKRLHADLFEKCRQYEIMKYTEGSFSRFTDLFKDRPDDRWDKRMKPEESLFYILSGYSFRTNRDVMEEPENSEKE